MGLKVRVDGDGSGFSATLDKLTKDAANFSENLSSKVSGNFSQAIMGIVPGLSGAIAGIFSAQAAKQAISEFIDMGDKIKFGAIRLNVDPETFQRIDRVMTEVKGDIGSVETAFDKLAVSATHIEEGAKDAEKLRTAFAELGVTGEDLKNQNYQDIFFKIAEGMKGIQPSKEQISAMRDIFGKGGDNLLPAMKLGFDSDFAKAGVIDKNDLAVIETYHQHAREADTATAGLWNHMKAFGTALADMAVHATNPFWWANRAGTPEEDGYHKKFMANQEARLVAIAAEKRAAQAIRDQREADAKKAKEKDEKEAAKINDETMALHKKNAEIGMTPEQKRLELLKQIQGIENDIDEGGNSLTREAQLKKQIEELKGQIATIDKAAAKPEKDKSHLAMSRLGNQAIGGIMLGHDMWRDLAKHSATSAKHLASIDKKTHPPKGKPANGDYE